MRRDENEPMRAARGHLTATSMASRKGKKVCVCVCVRARAQHMTVTSMESRKVKNACIYIYIYIIAA